MVSGWWRGQHVCKAGGSRGAPPCAFFPLPCGDGRMESGRGRGPGSQGPLHGACWTWLLGQVGCAPRLLLQLLLTCQASLHVQENVFLSTIFWLTHLLSFGPTLVRRSLSPWAKPQTPELPPCGAPAHPSRNSGDREANGSMTSPQWGLAGHGGVWETPAVGLRGGRGPPPQVLQAELYPLKIHMLKP